MVTVTPSQNDPHRVIDYIPETAHPVVIFLTYDVNNQSVCTHQIKQDRSNNNAIEG